MDTKSSDGMTLLNSLISNINSKRTPKRSFFSSLPFEIAPGLMITVNGYIPMNRQKPARTTWVFLGDDGAHLATSEARRVTDKLQDVKKLEIRKGYKFGGEYVKFLPEEIKSFKEWDMGDPFKNKGLRIIGFKPQSMLPIWASVKKSMFIFPNETDFTGSTRVFSALWQKLLTDKKMAIAWCIPRSNSTPVLMAIIPSAPKDDDNSTTPFLPAGLWLYPLPFADDIRENKKEKTMKCSPALIDMMRPIVTNLSLPKALYNPLRYPNPALQWHYRILQTLALNEGVPEHPEDATVPKFKQINKRVGGYIADFIEHVDQEANALQVSRAVKREAEEDADEPRPAKKAKAAPAVKKGAGAGGNMDTAKLKAAHDQGKLGKLTVAELKEILQLKNLSVTGKKADMVERLEEWVEENA